MDALKECFKRVKRFRKQVGPTESAYLAPVYSEPLNTESNRIQNEFFLRGTDSPDFKMNSAVNWSLISYMIYPLPVLELIFGGVFETNQISIGSDYSIKLRISHLHHPQSNGEIDLFFFDDDKKDSIFLGRFGLIPDDLKQRSFTLTLGGQKGRRGRFVIACLRGQVALCDLVIGREDRIPLLASRTFPDVRIKNENDHFKNVYHHEMYANSVETENSTEQNELQVRSAFEYGTMVLEDKLRIEKILFEDRLKSISPKDAAPIKVLSLCSGAARIEASIFSKVNREVDLTLFDINQDLLDLGKFSSNCRIKKKIGDINRLQLLEKYDVIMCVSALHHVVELEHVLGEVRKALTKNGEFWLIGEYIGRNGSMLWPETYEIANGFFSKLPEKYRKNAHTGLVDIELPNRDCSIGTFEGIRSEEIWALLELFFEPKQVVRQDCFLWRLLNLAYNDNYEIQNEHDRSLIEKAVDLEVSHHMNGGRPSALYGAFAARSSFG